jgi:AcrR family transcriptional regulator
MPGLRERKKAATRKAIHDGAIRLFGEQGFAGTTIDQIAETADVSRATVFHYFPTKESIVFGDAPQAIAALAALLEDAPEVVPAVREWLRGLTGWIEPDLQLQRRLAREVPDIAAHRLRVLDGIEDVVAEALTRELGAGAELAARLAAAALIAGFDVVEDAAVERMASAGRALEPAEIDALLDRAVAFARAGIAALRAG